MSFTDVINQSLRTNGLTGYATQAAPVIAAVEAHEAEVVESLIGFATEQGLGEAEARAALADAGLSVPAPATDATLRRQVADQSATIARLEAFARRHGYTGR